MFCSKCGKTIHRDDQICPSCQAPIGDNLFRGVSYTSAQFVIAPGQTDFEARRNNSAPPNDYTRTTYTSMDDAAKEGDEVDTRTTYRPVYEGGSMPVNVRTDARAAFASETASEAAAEEDIAEEEAPVMEAAPISPESYSEDTKKTLSDLEDDLQPEEAIDMSQFRSRPIQSTKRAGISRDVSEYIRKLEDDQNRRVGRQRRAAAPVYDDFQERTDDNPGGYSEYPGDRSYEEDYNDDYEQDAVFDEFDDADFDDMRRGRGFSIGSILKIVIALIVLAAIVFGVIKWVGYIRGNQSSSPIDGVSQELYEQGLALVKNHTSEDYINGLISSYTSDGIITVAAQLEADQNAIADLLPEEPAANDPIFINALQTIQENIGSAITMDALAVGTQNANAIEQSENNWQLVNASIQHLESSKTAEELTAVISGQKISMQAETPEPTEVPVESYVPMQKGDKSDKVLELQVRLYELGYLNDDRDGAYGGKTQTAVKAFQEKAGIEATGIADAATQKLLFSDQAVNINGQTVAAANAPVVTATPQPEVIQPAEVVESAAGAPADAPAEEAAQ